MEGQKIKKGTIRKIDNDSITLLNTDGGCEDTFPIYAQFAQEIRENIKIGNDVFYVIEEDQLLALGLEELVPFDVKILYELMPKDNGCSNGGG